MLHYNSNLPVRLATTATYKKEEEERLAKTNSCLFWKSTLFWQKNSFLEYMLCSRESPSNDKLLITGVTVEMMALGRLNFQIEGYMEDSLWINSFLCCSSLLILHLMIQNCHTSTWMEEARFARQKLYEVDWLLSFTEESCGWCKASRPAKGTFCVEL